MFTLVRLRGAQTKQSISGWLRADKRQLCVVAMPKKACVCVCVLAPKGSRATQINNVCVLAEIYSETKPLPLSFTLKETFELK